MARARVVLASPPSAPDSPDAVEISDTEVLLRWKQPKDDGNSTVLCYSLQCKEAGAFFLHLCYYFNYLSIINFFMIIFLINYFYGNFVSFRLLVYVAVLVDTKWEMSMAAKLKFSLILQ